jgi:ferredoxin--NADP+ reductase
VSGTTDLRDPDLRDRPPPAAGAARWTSQQVTAIHPWTSTLLSLRVTRPAGFRFAPGHYARLGLGSGAEDTVWRPYSMVSPPDAPWLEFLLVLVPRGEFSGRASALRPGDPVLVEQASLGFLTLDQLAPGESLWLLATGTGIGPFVSIASGPLAWQRFRRVVVVHGVRRAPELAYRDEIAAAARAAGASERLRYLPVVTREPGATALHDRIPELIEDGRLQQAADTPLEVASARVMACGNPRMTASVRALLHERGFAPSRRGAPGQMAFENYWT